MHRHVADSIRRGLEQAAAYARGKPMTNSHESENASLAAWDAQNALRRLTAPGSRHKPSQWLAATRRCDEPGLYAWWVDRTGARHLSTGLGVPVKAGLIYLGQAGATSRRSGKRSNTTLRLRIDRQHLNGAIGNTTFRVALAATLYSNLNLRGAAPRKLTDASEKRLTEWMNDHLMVSSRACPDRKKLGELEHALLMLKSLSPPLNIVGMPKSDVRTALMKKRIAMLQRLGRLAERP